tara:strand:- start:851 stop:1255 length:405 start_codon:yes stop_codon:yes gene_type:complete
MLGKLNHVAIAVNDISSATETYRDIFCAQVSEPLDQPEHGVTVVFITLQNTKIELISPLGNNSPINNFLIKNKNGGIHHICYEVNNLELAINNLTNNNYRIIGDNDPKIGAHGKPVIFLHPSDFNGTLIELQQE